MTRPLLALTILFLSLSALASEQPSLTPCPAPWNCEVTPFILKTDGVVFIRNGYLEENQNVPFNGNIIFYEGLGDSMVNHQPLFQKLTDAGYRVIAFDYMGQGGSSGSMDDTRILEIGKLGNKIWNLHARDLTNFPKKTILGWSTGGLAAYTQAALEGDVDTVVLIAPGISPKYFVGEQHPLRGEIDLITIPTLTTQIYGEGILDPHIDPIKPDSPVKIPCFSIDLALTAKMMRSTPMSRRMKGFVLLSGNKDTYVDAKETRRILRRTAPHFSLKQYHGALHEIDNEAEPISSMAHQDILNFLAQSDR
ncbi:alpha/beta hydrolase [Bdellovibrio svalbardensis]|uniref:Alpha/beta fold hydrolase n=1 Tax=Bdellovibrio svalbardensis TaxID=2972972 RepID=A0ABT6DKZ4_9BACT|nr:alpha/beta fold hydrolase [Bdellovibrio svalbardensis]MDG0817187.1 alpha/beta fold hydrolase [Bdellovibrio svalbardensis]